MFGNPRRKETYDFIFRVRSWRWEIHSLNFDFPAMVASLEAFCERQFLGRRITNELHLAVEELSVQYLVPTARRFGIPDPGIIYSVSVAEGGETASFEADCSVLAAAGVTLEDVRSSSDEISSALLRGILAEHDVDDRGIMTCAVK